MNVTVHKIRVPLVSRKCSFCNENTAVLEATGRDYCQHCFDGVVAIAWALAKREEVPSEVPTEQEARAAWLETVDPDFDILRALEDEEDPWSPSLPPR